MEIREAVEEDVPEIVALLKVSLGEELMPKSEAFWRWKHHENPFGKSPVLLAVDSGKIVGVRAFMRWEWKLGDKVFKAVRAVDTVTHPDFQGKGIFKKLTLQLVDHSIREGVDFVFNTPNQSSKPGYLKMGWKEHGRLRVSIRPVLSLKKRDGSLESRYPLDADTLRAWFKKSEHCGRDNNLVTNSSEAFLRWRFINNPNISYLSLTDPGSTFMVIFRVKQSRFGNEFRICHFLHTCNYDVRSFRNRLLNAAREAGAFAITFSEPAISLPSLAFNAGPIVTIRPLSLHNSVPFDLWKPTLGDMEVF